MQKEGLFCLYRYVAMFELPRDQTLSLLSDPYRFIARECANRGTDVFDTQLLLEPAVCMTGAEAARAFYTEARLQRQGAAPEPVRATLFGKEAVQGLDAAAHQARKAALLSILKPDNVARLVRRVRKYWGSFDRWAPPGYRLPLYETSGHVLTLSVCEWLGIPIRQGNLPALSADVTSLFNDAAGPRHLKARRARRRLERWLADLIGKARAAPPTGSAAWPLFHALIFLQDADAHPLAPRVAAVEVLNLIRPVVAVSVYIVWMAHALLCFPGIRATLANGDSRYRKAFVEEVRRFYPFFPAVMARVSESFTWKGHEFHEGARVLLDIHGTNRDPRRWHEPDTFQPERFLYQNHDAYAFVPQGGGDARTGHRCPGEETAVAIMLASIDVLLARLPSSSLIGRDLAINDRRMPAMPAKPLYIARR